jgi:hypothetical protein
MTYDFSGYATRNDLKCTDGRVIRKDAFKANDGERVPLVWQHGHKEPSNVLGHAILENREDGVYAYGVFNDTEAGKNTKILVQHGDIKALSIYANKLVQKGADVVHGVIREVSLVMTGANPGAFIDNVVVVHADGSDMELEDEAVIYTGLELTLEPVKHEEAEEDSGETVEDVFNTLSEKQKNVVYAMIAQIVADDSVKMEDDSSDEDLTHSDEEGENLMKNNVFDGSSDKPRASLTHEQFKTILADAQKLGSFKEAFLMHAGTYGIDNIDYLFPDAKAVRPTPDMIKRETDWVADVIGAAHHSPFSRIKSLAADITVETARALGYVTGNLKKEEVFGLLRRITTPTTVYKKQKLDRDDIVDITDMDVVAWLKAEMRVMLDEELARAVLISDGRDVASEDKINEANIRPIWTDDDMYAHHITMDLGSTTLDIIDEIVRARKYYKGSGNPTLFISTDLLTDMLLVRSTADDRRLYPTINELMSALRVSKIVEVPQFEDLTRTVELDTVQLLAIMVNMKDYTLGADKGGAVNFFDDFDIDYNQYKYLLETRVSGALTKPKSAVVIEVTTVAG